MRSKLQSRYNHGHSIQFTIKKSQGSLVDTYRNLTVGRRSLHALVKYEFITVLFGSLPGAVGFFLRKMYFPRLFRSVGDGTIFGRNIDITNGHRISIGTNCLIGQDCELGVKGESGGITIGNDVTIGRGTMLRTRNGKIVLGNDSKIGALCNIVSRGEPVSIGANNLMAAYCYMSTGTHEYNDLDVPIQSQDYITKPITIGEDVWIGVRSTVMAGSIVGDGSVIGASSLVNGEIPPYQVAVGIPAKPIKPRGFPEKS